MARMALIALTLIWMSYAQAQGTQNSSDSIPATKAVYDGWRASQLLASSIVSKDDGRPLGQVRNILIDADGRIAAVIMEGGGSLQLPQAVYRLPWQDIEMTPGKRGVAIAPSGIERPHYGLFPGTEGVATLPREFRVTEVIGDYARLQTGIGYGYVTDVVFTRDGRLAAVLVAREVASGGGIIAFPFPGPQSRWDPGASYYGLPFVTPDQAERGGIKVDLGRFSDDIL